MKNKIDTLVRRIAAQMYSAARLVDLRDIFVFAGLAMVCNGIAQIHAPSAWIVGGAAFFWIGASR